jgi:hypothetical protein
MAMMMTSWYEDWYDGDNGYYEDYHYDQEDWPDSDFYGSFSIRHILLMGLQVLFYSGPPTPQSQTERYSKFL